MNYITNIRLLDLPEKTADELTNVCERFPFKVNDYYLSLINFDDPNDPIKRIVIPHVDEMEDWGTLDASDEESYTVTRGVEHKYRDTAIVLITRSCECYCRFCFRKRLFSRSNSEVATDVSDVVDYIALHPEINNVLLTGGDSLTAFHTLFEICFELCKIDHVKVIRFGSKCLAYNPSLINDDLCELISYIRQNGRAVYFMAHFNHPRELTEQTISACNRLRSLGVRVCSQTPLLKGVNDSIETLSELFNMLSFNDIMPYYVFQCRPTIGNKCYAVPIETGLHIYKRAKLFASGLAKTSRFIMSHSTGKIEIIDLDDDYIYFKYHRTYSLDTQNIIKRKRNPEAYWFDDYAISEE